MNSPTIRSIFTVTLNPTIDRIIEIPDFRVNEHLRGRPRWRAPAGKALNVSRVLAALGTPNTALGWVGQQSMSEFYHAAASTGFTARFRPIEGCTRENITIVDPKAHTTTHIRDEGPTVTASDILELSAELADLADRTALMVFTGSLPRGLSPADFGHMLDSCIARGAMVAVDSSGEALREAAQRDLWLIKPNRVEVADVLGSEPLDEASVLIAGKRLNLRIPLVLITLGEAGSYCFTHDGIWRARVAVPPEQVRNTVGCGDALLAGFLSVMAGQPADFERALRQATAVAAASAMHELPAMFDRETVDRLLSGIELKRL